MMGSYLVTGGAAVHRSRAGVGPRAAHLSVCLAVCLLGAGCASSRQGPEPDRQTHWMRCEGYDECGALACVCGLCTATCERDADCEAELGAPSACAASDSPLAERLCPRRAPVPVCLPRCQEGRACPGAELALGEFTCEGLVAGERPEGLTLIGAGTIIDFSATSDGVYWLTADALRRADPDGRNARALERGLRQPTGLSADTRSVVWSESFDDAVVLRSLPVSGGRFSEIARLQEPFADPAHALALLHGDVFWLAGGQVLRTRKDTGRTRRLAIGDDWLLPQTLHVDNRHLYYIGTDQKGDMSVRRLPLDGSGQADELAHGLISGMTLLDDGVFYSRPSSALSGVGSAMHGAIWRVPSGGGDSKLVTETEAEPLGVATGDGYVYWSELDPEFVGGALSSAMWRLPVEGDWQPSQFLVGDVLVTKLMADPSAPEHVYLLGACYYQSEVEIPEQVLVRYRVR